MMAKADAQAVAARSAACAHVADAPAPPHFPSFLQTLDACLKEIATALLQADVNVRLVAGMRANVKKRCNVEQVCLLTDNVLLWPLLLLVVALRAMHH